MHRKLTTCLLLILIGLWSCAGMKEVPEGATSSGQTNGRLFADGPSDKELYQQALADLANDHRAPRYDSAKATLERLLKEHPQSRWAESAKVMVELISERSRLDARIQKDQKQSKALEEKAMRELAAIKEQLKAQEEKYAADIARVKQENEKLQMDLHELRNLELQLEKREKMLR